MIKPFFTRVLMVVCILAAPFSVADEEKPAESLVKKAMPSPTGVVQTFTDSLLAAVEEEGAAIAEDPLPYYSKVQDIMEQTVHFKFIAKGVMGPYVKSATKAEKVKFLAVFKEKLSETLAKAIANYSTSEITIEKEIPDEKNARKMYVSQKISGPDGDVRVIYTLGQWKKVGWKVSNMTLDGTNLGETYKNQFAQSVALNKGDIAKAIDWWVTNG